MTDKIPAGLPEFNPRERESREQTETGAALPKQNAAPDVIDVEPDDGGNAEAARWRRKLRDLEAQHATVTAQLDAVRRQRIEGLIADSDVKPEAVWAVSQVTDLLDDDGAVDSEKVNAAITAARDRFGIPKKSKGNYIAGIGNQPTQLPGTDKWTDAFSPQRR